MINKELAYRDSFIKENSPSEHELPDLINLEKFGFSERLNCVTEILDNAIGEGYSNKIALITEANKYTYQALLDKSNQVANYIVNELGVVPGNRVLLHAPNNFMMAACWLGIVKAGAITVAILPTLEPHRIVQIIQKAEIKVALYDDRYEACFTHVKQMTTMLTHTTAFAADLSNHSTLASQSPVFQNVDTAADDCCLIGFTSGTTSGNSKAAIHFHRDMLIACQSAGQQTFKITEKDILMGSPSLAFGFGLGALLLSALYCRASTVLIESPTPVALLENMDRHKPSVLFTSPKAYKAMAGQCDAYDISSLRLCVSGGEHILPTIWQAWKDKTNISIYEGIGCTEMLFLFLGPDINDIVPGRIGKPISGYEAKVIDSQGNDLPANAVGLLAVRGPLGCRYLFGERQTKYVRKGWNVTDDCVSMDEEGYFWFHGRSENEFTSHNGRLNLLELENALHSHDYVADCAVVKATCESAIHAYVHLETHINTDKPTLETTLKEHITMMVGELYCPESIKFVDSFPRTTSGKIQRHKLQAKEKV